MKPLIKFNRNQIGDTLVEVTMAIAILGLTMTYSFGTAIRAYNLGQTAKERTQIAGLAQQQMEALKNFRDSHTWSEFTSGGTFNGDSYFGVGQVLAVKCAQLSPAENCFHMELKKVNNISMWIPKPGAMVYDGKTYENGTSYPTVAGSQNYVGIRLKDLSTNVVTADSIDFMVPYGINSRGTAATTGEYDNNNTIFARLANLDPKAKVQQVANVPSESVCTERGDNLLAGDSGTFPRSLGATHKVDETLAGFKTDLPYRGENVFPDDEGVGGTTADQRGWGGGMTQITIPVGGRYFNDDQPATSNILIRRFDGDTTYQPAVPPATTALVTNPYQDINEPPGTKKNPTYTGKLWEKELTGLEPNTHYDFVVYVANIFTNHYLSFTPNASNPVISLNVVMGGGTGFRTDPRPITPKQSQWEPIRLSTITDNTGKATFYLNDTSGKQDGDDFAMTALGVYKCKN